MNTRVAGPSPADPRFRRTTLAKVARYSRRHRYFQRGCELVEIVGMVPWGKHAYRIWLDGIPEGYFVVDADRTAFVRQGPCRRDGRVS
jgi:hypothetical protein